MIKRNKLDSNLLLRLKSFTDLHLYGYSEALGIIKNVKLFSLIAFLILLIACFNFINLTTAKSSSRALEISLRKVVGADKKNIIMQVYTELVFIVVLSFLLSLILLYLLTPVYSSILEYNIDFSISNNLLMMTGFFVIVILTGIIAGTYPGFILSSFKPAGILQKKSTRTGKSSFFRKILIISQFVISVILIICTLIITKQFNYLKNKDLGFNKHNIIYIELLSRTKQQYQSIKQEFLINPTILNVSTASSLPGNSNNYAGDLDWEGKPETQKGAMNFISIDPDYFKTMGIKLINGRDFALDRVNDLQTGFIVNEEALKLMSMDSPIEKRFRMWHRNGKIIGVVENFHNLPLRYQISPVFFTIWPYFNRYLIANISAENINQTIAYMENTMKKFNPDMPFEFNFLDQKLDSLYDSEKRFGKLISYFTYLAIFISCLGLFGLAIFIMEQRTKEIGIRKVLGASISNIIRHVTKDFIIFIVLANIIAWPLGYYFMHKWLQNFAYKEDINILIFLISGFISLALILVTVSLHGFRAANANPVDSLRNE